MKQCKAKVISAPWTFCWMWSKYTTNGGVAVMHDIISAEELDDDSGHDELALNPPFAERWVSKLEETCICSKDTCARGGKGKTPDTPAPKVKRKQRKQEKVNTPRSTLCLPRGQLVLQPANDDSGDDSDTDDDSKDKTDILFYFSRRIKGAVFFRKPENEATTTKIARAGRVSVCRALCSVIMCSACCGQGVPWYR
eukprot:m.231577 g.231577  ORF g.231577 m.231577 type:complete len:196 (-) comp19267_c0_seq22:1882-2469(-)